MEQHLSGLEPPSNERLQGSTDSESRIMRARTKPEAARSPRLSTPFQKVHHEQNLLAALISGFILIYVLSVGFVSAHTAAEG